MANERTLAIIKPDALAARHQASILQRIIQEGFEIVALQQLHLSQRQVESFYAEHQGQYFFEGLCNFMTSGPSIVVALERENAVSHWREVIGKTNPEEAAIGTIRKEFGSKTNRNAVHGSDSVENGRKECAFFFAEMNVC